MSSLKPYKPFLMLVLTLLSLNSMADSIESTIYKVGVLNYENYAFIKLDQSTKRVPDDGCATNDTTLVFDYSTDKGKLMYSTALLAYSMQKRLWVDHYGWKCPEGVPYMEIRSFHINER